MEAVRSSLIIFALTFAISSCNSGVSDKRVDEAWSRNEAIVERAINREGYGDLEYVAACRFFVELTGIQIANDITTEGVVPTKQAAKDFSDIKRWYKDNRGKLCWDVEEESVVVCEVSVHSKDD